MYKLFMRFENPTRAIAGVRRSVQGFSVYGDTAFVLYHTGICAAYDLRTRDPSPISVFSLGSFCDSEADRRYINHANDAMFGTHIAGEEFPLLYVTAGNSGESDARGYIAYCAVEQIRREGAAFRSETVQRIYYRDEELPSPYHTPGWGWPASLVDTEAGAFYLFSAKYRTKKEFTKPDNQYIITKFALPPHDVREVTLGRADILDQFTLPLYALVTQGGTVRRGVLYYTFGFGKEEYPNALIAVDLAKKDFAFREMLTDTPFASQEVECCAFYGERLLINTQGEEIYERV